MSSPQTVIIPSRGFNIQLLYVYMNLVIISSTNEANVV
jgi:hypothetical protein